MKSHDLVNSLYDFMIKYYFLDVYFQIAYMTEIKFMQVIENILHQL